MEFAMIDMHIHAVNPQLPGVMTLPDILDGPPEPVVRALREQMEQSGTGILLGMGHLPGRPATGPCAQPAHG
jgi:hypothetical protein